MAQRSAPRRLCRQSPPGENASSTTLGSVTWRSWTCLAVRVTMLPKTGIYDALEPKLNAGEVELLDIPELQEQLLTLVIRNGKIDHQPGDHDDYANAAAGALWLVSGQADAAVIGTPIIVVGGYNR